MLVLQEDNPTPFRQPFLELELYGEGAKKLGVEHVMWLIDVNGRIEKYITEHYLPTRRLERLCRSLAKCGILVKSFQRYTGSAGPHVILRNGALFYRMNSIEAGISDVPAYAYTRPTYRGAASKVILKHDAFTINPHA
jgi:hypothetical protein